MKLFRRRYALPVFLLLVFAAGLAACGIPGPKATEAERAAIKGEFYEVGPPLDIRMFAKTAGDPGGQRVIFIHGTPGGVDEWADFLLNVPEGLEYVALDRAGFGRSGPWRAVTSLKDQAAAIAPLLVERGGRWPVLVAHSLGGPIAAQVAVDYPGKVGGIVMLAASLDPALEEVQPVQYVARYLGLEYLIPRRIRNANRELMELEPHLRALAPRLQEIKCPVMIVHGTADPLVPYSNVDFMKQHITGAPVRVFPLEDRNHFLPWHSKPVIDEVIGLVAGEGAPECRT